MKQMGKNTERTSNKIAWIILNIILALIFLLITSSGPYPGRSEGLLFGVLWAAIHINHRLGKIIKK